MGRRTVKKSVDTNILVRTVVLDDPEQAKQSVSALPGSTIGPFVQEYYIAVTVLA